MSRLREFLRNPAGAAAAEFALVLPIALLFFFGILDVGRYVWTMNELEKAVQMGTRYAVATDVVAGRLKTADYTKTGIVCPDSSGSNVQVNVGATICKNAQGTVTCSKSTGTLACTCTQTSLGANSCQGADNDVNATAFTAIVKRMKVVEPDIDERAVTVTYSNSGIGYAGDPATTSSGAALSDTSPVVTVQVQNLTLRLMLLLGGAVQLPSFSYSQTLEDGDGSVAY